MPWRVAIADDSDIFREVLREVLEADGDIRVVAEAATGVEAVERSRSALVDLWTIDLQMPAMDGLATVEQLMARRPTPILVLTGQTGGPGIDMAFEAMERGALDLMEKRHLSADGGRGLRERIRQLVSVKVVRRSAPRPALASPGRAAVVVQAPLTRPALIAIGASTGGPRALAQILRRLPPTFTTPIAIVQHLPQGHCPAFARFLQGHTRSKVMVVERAVALQPGMIFLAPEDRHLVLGEAHVLGTDDSPPRHGHRPSVDVLFESIAAVAGSQAVGVLLTGMGADGAQGLKSMRHRGATTIAQDERSCAVYGMPRAAVELGAAGHVLPAEQIAAAVALAGAAPLAPA